jgi:hypothetical protein
MAVPDRLHGYLSAKNCIETMQFQPDEVDNLEFYCIETIQNEISSSAAHLHCPPDSSSEPIPR